MSDQLQAQRNQSQIITQEQKNEYTESLKNIYLNESGVSNSRRLHSRHFEGNARAFETNLLDAIPLKGEEAGFIQRAKTLIANRDQYAYADQVERCVDEFLDNDNFVLEECTNNFWFRDRMSADEIKARNKDIVAHVNNHGIERLNNLNDIISWMDAHIAIKGDDKGQFERILQNLRSVQDQFKSFQTQVQFSVNSSKEDVLPAINNLSDSINSYMTSHSKKPFTQKGKQRIAVCQILMALTGKMYLEAEKVNIKAKLDGEREETLSQYDEKWCDSYQKKFPGSKSLADHLNSRKDMKEWIIANGRYSLKDYRDIFLDFCYLADNPEEKISNHDSILNVARDFKKKALAHINAEYNVLGREEMKVLLREVERVEAGMKWSKENEGAYYKEILTDTNLNPEALNYLKLVDSHRNLPDIYVQALDNEALSKVQSSIEGEKERAFLNAALENEQINNLVAKLRINPFRTKSSDGHMATGKKLDNLGGHLNHFAKRRILNIYININKNDKEAYKNSADAFLKDVVGYISEAMQDIIFTKEMESPEWYMRNADKIEQLCNYGEAIDEIKKIEELSAVYGTLDEKKRNDIAVYADFWKAYRNRMADLVQWQKAIAHPGIETNILSNFDEIESVFEEKKKALLENEKDNEKRVRFRAESDFDTGVASCFEEILEKKSKIPAELMDDYIQLEGVVRVLKSKRVKSEDIGSALAILEKLENKLNIKPVTTLMNVCKTYGMTFTGKEKENFDREYGYIFNPQKHFDFSEAEITKLTKKIDNTSEITKMDRIFYGLSFKAGKTDQNDIDQVNLVNECSRIIIELMHDKEVKRFLSENTDNMLLFMKQIDINYSDILSHDLKQNALTKKWLDNPLKYGFKAEGGKDDLTLEKLVELREAQKRKFFHTYIEECYSHILREFVDAVSKGTYDGSEENREKYRAMIKKLKKGEKVFSMQSKHQTLVTEAIELIQLHKDFIPEEGVEKSKIFENYRGIKSTYRDILIRKYGTVE